jgi:hypothetical protein
VLIFAYLARASGGGFLASVVLAGVAALWLDRQKRAQFRENVTKLGIAALAAVAFSALIVILMPSEYWNRGQILGSFWHRAAESLGTNPDWPPPAMRAEFDCSWNSYFKDGLIPGLHDSNPDCIWYAENRGKSDADLNAKILDPDFEAGMRHAVVRSIELDPMGALLTLVWYKPGNIGSTLQDAFDFRNAATNPIALLCVSIQCVLFLMFIVCGVLIFGKNLFLQWLAFAVLGLLSIPQYFVAWATLHTGVDLIFFEFSIFVLLFAMAIEGFTRLYRPRIIEHIIAHRNRAAPRDAIASD